jgi:hypothetical protein
VPFVGQLVTVYGYWTWVPGEGLGKIACKKRTQGQIEAMAGLPIPFTGEEVDESKLCPVRDLLINTVSA